MSAPLISRICNDSSATVCFFAAFGFCVGSQATLRLLPHTPALVHNALVVDENLLLHLHSHLDPEDHMPPEQPRTWKARRLGAMSKFKMLKSGNACPCRPSPSFSGAKPHLAQLYFWCVDLSAAWSLALSQPNPNPTPTHNSPQRTPTPTHPNTTASINNRNSTPASGIQSRSLWKVERVSTLFSARLRHQQKNHKERPDAQVNHDGSPDLCQLIYATNLSALLFSAIDTKNEPKPHILQ